jgi:hypothetical protein
MLKAGKKLPDLPGNDLQILVCLTYVKVLPIMIAQFIG